MTADAKTPKRPGRPARDDVRQSVLAAADQLLRTHGLEPITVADLLELGGVSRTTFYKHFSGRDDVIAELYIDHVNSARVEVVTKMIGAEHLQDLLSRATAGYLLVMLRRGPLTREFAKLRFSNEKMRDVRDGVVDGYQAAVNSVQSRNGLPGFPRFIVEAFVSGIESLGHSISLRTDLEATEDGINQVMAELERAALSLIPQRKG